MKMQHRTEKPLRAVWLGLLAVLLGGTALRLAFLLVSHPHVDEYSTMWAALNILQKGVPVLPSGFVYLQGLLFSYADAAAIAVLGFSEWAARLPSLLCSVATIALVFVWGRRAFGPWAGLLAATLTALEPTSIIWGGRARMYSLQQALTVLALYACYRGYIEARGNRDSTRWYGLFAVSLIGAMLSQTVTILVVPGLIAALFVWRRQWLNRPAARWALLAVALSIPLAFLLNQAGGPVSDTVGRTFVDPSLPWRTKPEFFFREFFWAWPALIRTVLFIAGFVLLVLHVRQQRQPADGTTALFYVYLVVSATLLCMVFLVGESWQRPRYLTMIQPAVDLLTAGVLWLLWHQSGRWWGATGRTTLAVLVWLGALVIFLPPAIRTIGPSEPAYDLAFRFVRERWQAGDAIIGPLPSIAGTYLGQCDGYVLQNGYEEYLMWRDSHPIDRWTGASLIDSSSALEQQFLAGQRVWFVVDDIRWEQRYTPEFRDYVTQTMPVAYQTTGIAVYMRPGSTAEQNSNPADILPGEN